MEKRDSILMIHGMWCGSWAWKNQINFFEEKGLICKAPNLRFHEEGSRNPHPDLRITSLLDYADDLEKDALSLREKYGDRPIGMGHSMGGLLGQMLASRKLFKALILLAPAIPRGIDSVEPSVLEFFLPMLVKARNFWRKPIKPSFDNAARFMLNKFPKDEQREIYKKLCHESGRVAFEIGFWQLEWFRRASKVRYKKIDCPVRVVVGENDEITPVVPVKKNVEKYKKKSSANLVFRVYPNHSHWLPSEPGWERITEDNWEWLKPLTNL